MIKSYRMILLVLAFVIGFIIKPLINTLCLNNLVEGRVVPPACSNVEGGCCSTDKQCQSKSKMGDNKYVCVSPAPDANNWRYGYGYCAHEDETPHPPACEKTQGGCCSTDNDCITRHGGESVCQPWAGGARGTENGYGHCKMPVYNPNPPDQESPDTGAPIVNNITNGIDTNICRNEIERQCSGARVASKGNCFICIQKNNLNNIDGCGSIAEDYCNEQTD